MTKIFKMKFAAGVICLCLVIAPITPAYAGKYFVSSSGNGGGHEVMVGYKFNFGSQPDNKKDNDYLERLKQEDTSGAGSLIGLLILGGCIVAAAILIVNKADDVTDKADDKTDELQDWAEEKYDDIQGQIDDLQDEYEDGEESLPDTSLTRAFSYSR